MLFHPIFKLIFKKPELIVAHACGYAALARQFPNVAIFPGRRSAGRSLRAVRLRDGGQGFSIPYTLHDGCHACRIVGDLELRWDFDVEGRFVRIAVQRARARPDR